MTGKQWYYAQLRWAVMVEGKQGLRAWKEAVHIFLSEDEQSAFQQALEIGRLGETSTPKVGGRWRPDWQRL